MDKQPYIHLLRQLISTSSLSGEENHTAAIITQFLEERNIDYERKANNIIAYADRSMPYAETVVLNSHHDTVKPNAGWTYPPFAATVENGKLIGLGSNDAGGALVALIAAFDALRTSKLTKNLVLIASAEEENSGPKGIRSILPALPFEIDLAIIGEPTQMRAAIAEKGLLVIDGLATGVSGHAARPHGQNALDKAVRDISKINAYQFDKESAFLGPAVKSVTQINAGTQHNVIPDACTFVIDVRVNERYTLQEIMDTLQALCESKLTARSFRNKPSFLPLDHSFMKIVDQFGLAKYGSPTLSDQAHFSCPSIKIGPGMSSRSHTANEFIYLREIEEGIDLYIQLLRIYIT